MHFYTPKPMAHSYLAEKPNLHREPPSGPMTGISCISWVKALTPRASPSWVWFGLSHLSLVILNCFSVMRRPEHRNRKGEAKPTRTHVILYSKTWGSVCVYEGIWQKYREPFPHNSCCLKTQVCSGCWRSMVDRDKETAHWHSTLSSP